MIHPTPYDQLDPAAQREVDLQVAQQRLEGVDGALYVLTSPRSPDPDSHHLRRHLAAQVVKASLWLQAGLLGLVACSRCGDRGCDWCNL